MTLSEAEFCPAVCIYGSVSQSWSLASAGNVEVCVGHSWNVLWDLPTVTGCFMSRT